MSSEVLQVPAGLKTTNEVLAREEFQSKTEFLASRPVQLEIEITTYCNLKCFVCRRTYFGQKNMHLSRDVFERFAEGTFATGQCINLTGLGEPMLSPDFEYFYRKSADHGLYVGFVTNGTMLTEKWLEHFASEKTHFFVSIDSATAETSRRMRPGLKHEKLLNLLKKWPGILAQAPGSQARLMLNVVPTLLNVHEIPDIVRLAAEYHVPRMEVLVPRLDGFPLDVQTATIEQDPERVAGYFAQAREIAAKAGVTLIIPPGYDVKIDTDLTNSLEANMNVPVIATEEGCKYPLECSAPWWRVHVNVDGSVHPCCIYPYSMGNLTHESFEEIWNGLPYRKIRRRINSRFPTLPCKDCRIIFGINAGKPELVFEREGPVDRAHTYLQRLRRKLGR